MQLGAILAHGVGGRSDLPVPVWLFSYGAGSALVISFVTLHILWRKPRLDAVALGSPAPSWIRSLATPAAFFLRVAGLAIFGLVITAAWFGDKSAVSNISPIIVYILFWVGLQAGCLVFGDLWALLSPWNTLGLVVERFRRSPQSLSPDNDSSTHWPATFGIGGFVWLELCYHDPSSPRVIAIALSIYTLAMVVVLVRHGRQRLSVADGFAGWFGLLASMAPLYRDNDQGSYGLANLRLRWPFTGLAEVKPRRGTLALVMVVLGSTAFDGLSRSSWWRDLAADYSGWGSTIVSSIGLSSTIVIMAAVYVGAMKMVASIGGRESSDLETVFLSSLIPIALAYAIGHYFSLFIFEGQQVFSQASDPFGRGWDLFGTIDWVVNYNLISTDLISWIQVIAIVGGHVTGVVIAHDRAMAMFDIKVATKSQIPLLVVMVTYTIGGLTLLLGA